jgi:cbb3-type cytochrome oxidase maturation protein
MSVLVLLIFASLAIATGFLFAFIWAVRSGQYEDTSTPSLRILIEEPLRKQANHPAEPHRKNP